MRYKKFGSKFIVRLSKGEEVVSTLKQFCQDQRIKLGTIIGIGATDQVEVGLFDPQIKKYRSRKLIDNYEISSLLGNITTMNNEVYLHLHITLADGQQRSFGGHLSSAVVSATFEAVIEVIEGEVGRHFDAETRLNLLSL